MQQTTKYQFKLIEGSDDFSPQPLNDNVEKVEQALTEFEAALEEVQEATQVLPYATGTYTGDGSATNRTITLGFRPKFVIITGMSRGTNEDSDSLDRFGLIGLGKVSSDVASLTNTGFTIQNNTYEYPQLNQSGSTYSYIAFK